LTELHRAAAAVGSAWSEDQVALMLECLPDVEKRDGLYVAAAREEEDPIVQALLQIVGEAPIPAAVLVQRMPRGLVVTPAGLCDIARRHAQLELEGPNRIRRKI
jgi:hypothetical protein